jgi:hypothetical protein
MKTEEVRFMFKKYMAIEHIETFQKLAKLTGIKYQTLLDHLEEPSLFRKYEIENIHEVLHFSNEDLISLITT